MRPAYECKSFDEPVTGLAAMIFLRAVMDAEMLKSKHREYLFTRDKEKISIQEIAEFARSEWAEYLAGELSLDIQAVRRWAAKYEEEI